MALSLLGIQHEAINRLDLFKLRLKIEREFKDHPSQSDVLFLLDMQAEMRRNGLEPKHNGKRYL